MPRGRKPGSKGKLPKPFTPPFAPVRGTPGVVRCLGPGATEHTFHSPDRFTVRVCPACRSRQVEVPLICLHPVPTPACWD